MISRTEKARLGVFLISSITVLIITVIVLAGMQLMKPVDNYVVRFEESISGLEVGAQVKFNGVRVGQIEDIEIDRENMERVLVKLGLRKGTPLKADSTALLVGMGITGLKFVELTAGSKGAVFLEPGAEIKAGRLIMGSLEGRAQDIAIKVELALNRLNSVLSEENVTNVTVTLDNARAITTGLSTIFSTHQDDIDSIISDVAATTKDLKTTMASLDRSAKSLETILTTAEPKVPAIMDNVSVTVATLRGAAVSISKVDVVLAEVQKTLLKFNDQLSGINVVALGQGAQKTLDEATMAMSAVRQILSASRENIYQSSHLLKSTLKNFEKFSAEIEQKPSLLLFSDDQKEKTPPDRKR